VTCITRAYNVRCLIYLFIRSFCSFVRSFCSYIRHTHIIGSHSCTPCVKLNIISLSLCIQQREGENINPQTALPIHHKIRTKENSYDFHKNPRTILLHQEIHITHSAHHITSHRIASHRIASHRISHRISHHITTRLFLARRTEKHSIAAVSIHPSINCNSIDIHRHSLIDSLTHWDTFHSPTNLQRNPQSFRRLHCPKLTFFIHSLTHSLTHSLNNQLSN